MAKNVQARKKCKKIVEDANYARGFLHCEGKEGNGKKKKREWERRWKKKGLVPTRRERGGKWRKVEEEKSSSSPLRAHERSRGRGESGFSFSSPLTRARACGGEKKIGRGEDASPHALSS